MDPKTCNPSSQARSIILLCLHNGSGEGDPDEEEGSTEVKPKPFTKP